MYVAKHHLHIFENIILLFILCITLTSSQIADNRCFLENGGSGEVFFANEDLSIGSKIGKLHIIGDPSEHGNIVLHLKETDSPIVVLPGSKDLSLVRRLDKEGIEGPSSVFIHVICEKTRSSDPGFIIPINIRVTDANDNAPQFINAPYVLNISEVTVVGTRVIQGIKAIDADQQGPFSTVQYLVIPGPHSDYFVFVNELEGTLVLRKPLDYETVSNFTISLRAQDQGNPPRWSDTLLYVNVIDADDQNPKFFVENYSTTIPENAKQGYQLKLSPKELIAYDQDIGINAPIYYTFNSADALYQYFYINRTTGHIFLAKNIEGNDFLQPVTLVVRAIQYDNIDRYALATLVIRRSGTPVKELSFLKKEYSISALENLPVNYLLQTVSTNKLGDPRVRYWLSNDFDGLFYISPLGEIVLRQSLDYETKEEYVFLVYATDGHMNTSTKVNVSVLNVNDWDPRFRYPQYEFFLSQIPMSELTPGSVIGKVEAADGDKTDEVSISLKGPYERMFSINKEGEIIINDLTAMNMSTVHLVAVATDTGVPPRQASVPVIIHFPEPVVYQGSNRILAGTNFTVTILAAMLTLLGIIIVVLIVVIQKKKHMKESSGNVTNNRNMYLPNPMYPDKHLNVVAVPKAQDSQTESVTDSQCNPGSGASMYNYMKTARPNQFNSNKKLAPPPPQIPNPSLSQRSSSTLNGAKRNNIIWPLSTVPRRVKKLSWDDEGDQYHRELELDLDVGITPLINDNVQKTSDTSNLIVYF